MPRERERGWLERKEGSKKMQRKRERVAQSEGCKVSMSSCFYFGPSTWPDGSSRSVRELKIGQVCVRSSGHLLTAVRAVTVG